MKIKVELDVTPKEVLELFEGNMDTIQKALLALFMQKVKVKAGDENYAAAMWQEYWEKSKEVFEASLKKKNNE